METKITDAVGCTTGLLKVDQAPMFRPGGKDSDSFGIVNNSDKSLIVKLSVSDTSQLYVKGRHGLKDDSYVCLAPRKGAWLTWVYRPSANESQPKPLKVSYTVVIQKDEKSANTLEAQFGTATPAEIYVHQVKFIGDIGAPKTGTKPDDHKR